MQAIESYTYSRIRPTKKRGQKTRKDRIRLTSLNGEPCDRILTGFIAVERHKIDGIMQEIEVTISAGNARPGVDVPFLLQVEEKLPAMLDLWAKEIGFGACE